MRLLLLSAFFVLCRVTVHASGSVFKAAVYEHAFVGLKNKTYVPTRKEALQIVMKNMDVYEQQIENAKLENVRIIVFPEYGLTGFVFSRESFQPFLENIPDPTKTEWNACENPKPDNSTAILHRLSCLAKDNDMYLVVNIGDIKPCTKSTDPNCPADGRYQYNTNVAFDNKGKLIARYHKQHPFSSEAKVINTPVQTEFITFESPFGKFGTFTCFDVLYHDPAVSLVDKYDIDHVVFPTAWFDVLPLLTAIGFHSSWARGMGVNFLAANSHVPSLQNTGSGIYSYTGAKAFYRSFTKNGFLLIATLPVSRRKSVNVSKMSNVSMSSSGNAVNDKFYSFLHRDLFLFKELVKVNDTLNICYNNSATCCSLTYEMASKRSDEMYALGVYDGIHASRNPRYFRTCTLVKCLSLEHKSCGGRVSNAKTIFKSILLKSHLNATHVFPQVVADGVTLLPGEWTNGYPANYMQTTQQLTKGLITAALFARVYDLDPPPATGSIPTESTNSATSTPKTFTFHFPVSSILAFVCLVLAHSVSYA